MQGEKVETGTDFLLGFKITVDSDCSHEIGRWLMVASWQESHDKFRQCVKKQRHHFANKGPFSQRLYSFQ